MPKKTGESSEFSEEEDPFADLFTDEKAYKPELDKDTDSKPKPDSHRETFVGTALYATPEMLNSSISGPFTDLWALGVIAYQVISGDTPWSGFESAVFDQIRNRKVSFPKSMPIEAVDFIDKLLNLNPLQRLGVSSASGKIDFSLIKEHPFLKELNFDRIR